MCKHFEIPTKKNIKTTLLEKMKYLFVVPFIILTGCATQTSQSSVTIFSQPVGAYLVEMNTGTSIGLAPNVAVYDNSLLFTNMDENGCFRLNGWEATWPSGAKATSQQVLLMCGGTGAYNITLSRPANHPNLQQDLEFALQVESIRAQQRQTEAAEAAAFAAIFGAFQPQSVNCVSQTISGIVSTNCR